MAGQAKIPFESEFTGQSKDVTIFDEFWYNWLLARAKPDSHARAVLQLFKDAYV